MRSRGSGVPPISHPGSDRRRREEEQTFHDHANQERAHVATWLECDASEQKAVLGSAALGSQLRIMRSAGLVTAERVSLYSSEASPRDVADCRRFRSERCP